jgi:hypothetical protein
MPLVVAHPFTGVVPERVTFDLVCDVGATAYFPGARAEGPGRPGILVDLRVTTTGEVVADLRALDVPAHVIAAAAKSDPKGLVFCADDENAD